VFGKCDGILEGSLLPLKKWIHLAYFWAHNSAGQRADDMLGLGSTTLSSWSEFFRISVMNGEATHTEKELFGGKDAAVEADECEVGRKRKGLHGRDSGINVDFMGLFEQRSGRLLVEAYQKLKKDDDDQRFGPPSAHDVRPLVERLHPDGAMPYTSVCKELGVFNAQVDHNKGEFSRRETIKGKLRVVSTQGIDGACENIKTFLRARGGCSPENLESSVKQFQC